MKNLVALLCALSLTACVSPNYMAAKNSEFTRANYEAVDKLMAVTAVPIDKYSPLLVATVVNIDSMGSSSRFGRLVSEQVASRLTQLGFIVTEMKLRNDVYIQEGTGELLLSRDVRDLSKNYKAQVVVVGNYAVAAGYVYLTLKAVTVTDNRVITAVNYVLPVSGETQALLQPRE
jgi:TolB-like protein